MDADVGSFGKDDSPHNIQSLLLVFIGLYLSTKKTRRFAYCRVPAREKLEPSQMLMNRSIDGAKINKSTIFSS